MHEQFALTSLAEPAEGLSGFEVRLKVVDLASDMNNSLWFIQSDRGKCMRLESIFPRRATRCFRPSSKFIDEILTKSL